MPRKRFSARRKSVRNTVKHRKRRGATRRRRRTHRGGRSLFQRGGGGPAGGPAPGPASRMPRVAGLPTPTGEEAAAMEKRMAKAAEVRQQLEEARKQAVGARDDGPGAYARRWNIPRRALLDLIQPGAIAESMKTPVPPTDPKIHKILIDLYLKLVDREYTAREPNLSPPKRFLSNADAKRMLLHRGVIKEI
jgi:hypothetical protein